MTNTSPWSSANGSRKTVSSRSATVSAAPMLRDDVSSTTNSPPERRATMLSAGAIVCSREATSTRSSSPVAWPRLSLMFLNRSRSMKYIVGKRSGPHCVVSARSVSFSSSARLGSSVNGSVCADRSNSSCATLFARTVRTTRNVTAAARIVADIERTQRSSSLYGLVAERAMTGMINEPVVNTNRPSTRIGPLATSGCMRRVMLGWMKVAPAQK